MDVRERIALSDEYNNQETQEIEAWYNAATIGIPQDLSVFNRKVGEPINAKSEKVLFPKPIYPEWDQGLSTRLGDSSSGISDIINTFISADLVSGYNWTLKDGALGPWSNGLTTQYNKSLKRVTTTIDSKKFTNASDLSIARTMMHEAAHAYLVAYFVNDPLTAREEYPEMVDAWTDKRNQSQNDIHHDAFTNGLVSKIAVSLAEYGDTKNYTFNSAVEKKQFYNDLAWGGLTDTRAFNNLTLSERNRINDLISSEQYQVDRNGDPMPSKGKKGGC